MDSYPKIDFKKLIINGLYLDKKYHQDSNLNLKFRKLPFYPLNYEAAIARQNYEKIQTLQFF